MDTIITLSNVSKIFNPGMPDEYLALSDVSLDIGKGRVTVLKGPSGSGKTTLLGLIGCMARPTEGVILVEGRNVAKLPERFLTTIRRNTFGFMFQQFNLVKEISVLENIMLPLYVTDITRDVMEERAELLLERLDLSRKKNSKAHKLSGGEQQRVAIARALINEPDIILADEPTAHLDSKLSADLIDIFQRLNEEGKTIVIATHDPLIYTESFVHNIISMRDGRVQEVQTV